MMWLIADYQPVTLFSLKNSLATSSGGKSLLVPTPYAFKMALLDAACRLWGVSEAEAAWPMLRDLPMAVSLPERAVVTNLFAKILKPRRSQPGPGSPDAGPLGRTIAFREYVWTDGVLSVALELDENVLEQVSALLLQVNYLGKRGGFLQILRPPRMSDTLPDGFIRLNPADDPTTFDSRGLMQVLDDCGPKMTFEQADVYSSKRVRLGMERILHHVVLPYQLTRSSRSYSLYERFDA
jgi:hypothetical protein